MKAGLKAHVKSLTTVRAQEDEINSIAGQELRNPGVYEKFVAFRKDNHQPIPPGRHIGMAGHHWLKYCPQITGSADQGELMVAQWSPTMLRWFPSNGLASMTKPLYGDGLMTCWEYITDVPVPDFGPLDNKGESS